MNKFDVDSSRPRIYISRTQCSLPRSERIDARFNCEHSSMQFHVDAHVPGILSIGMQFFM